MGRRISKEFLHPSILEGVNNKIGNLDSLETDAKGNMVQAINELVEKLDNSAELEVLEGEIAEGKDLIANAVGEPLTAEESFDEMSNDINGLLSTFKTNMMNNGITVESGDRFKQLIDKIATMVEEGESKGVQFASGNIVGNYNIGKDDDGNVLTSQSYTLNADFGFVPTLLFVYCNTYYSYNTPQMSGVVVSNLADFVTATTNSGEGLSISNITENSFDLKLKHYGTQTMYIENLDWYAIGVGEEDTTLRDSLASILENKGVNVTPEDDMASLINKVDSGFPKVVSGTDVTFVKNASKSASVPMTGGVWYPTFTWEPILSGVYNITCDYGCTATGSAMQFNGRICVDRVSGEREIVIVGDGYAQSFRTFSSCEVNVKKGDSVVFEIVAESDKMLIAGSFKNIMIEGTII